MFNLLSRSIVNLGVVVGLITTVVGQFIYFSNKVQEIERERTYFEMQYKRVSQELKICYESQQKQLEQTINSLKQKCTLEKKQLEKQIEVCRKRLDRLQRLKDKLEEIDNL